MHLFFFYKFPDILAPVSNGVVFLSYIPGITGVLVSLLIIMSTETAISYKESIFSVC
jgi:hypothetical protein